MKRFAIFTTLTLALFVLLAKAGAVLANYGLDQTAGAAQLVTNRTVPEIVGQVIGAALSLVGILFFILMVYAGFNWMMARGNEELSKTSLRTIVAAIIGLIIVLASYTITSFVFQSVSGGPLGP